MKFSTKTQEMFMALGRLIDYFDKNSITDPAGGD